MGKQVHKAMQNTRFFNKQAHKTFDFYECLSTGVHKTFGFSYRNVAFGKFEVGFLCEKQKVLCGPVLKRS